MLNNPSPGIYLVDDFFSAEECQAWIKRSEALGYEKAGISRGNRQVVNLAVRNNDRVIMDDRTVAKDLFARSRAHLPDQLDGLRLIGLNERWRFYRYGFHQQFRPHQDLSYQKSRGVWSEYTFLIYLNDNYGGGQTRFTNYIVEPRAGRLLVFKHQLLHEGSPVTEGIKYVMRTDVMYRKVDQP